MKTTILPLTLLLILISTTSFSQEPDETVKDREEKVDTIAKYRTDGTKEYEVKTRNGLRTGSGFWFDSRGNILGVEHYQNDTLNGYTLLLNEETFRPKHIFERIEGRPSGVVINFYDNGAIKDFRSADIFHDSQILEFHENGVIKEIGQTKKGKAHGTFFYFDDTGKLEKKIEYFEGNIKR